jgi:hypothetical protein
MSSGCIGVNAFVTSAGCQCPKNIRIPALTGITTIGVNPDSAELKKNGRPHHLVVGYFF